MRRYAVYSLVMLLNQLSSRRKIVLYPGNYTSGFSEYFSQTSTAAIQWFQQHLATP
jgi:hypothetical protein